VRIRLVADYVLRTSFLCRFSAVARTTVQISASGPAVASRRVGLFWLPEFWTWLLFAALLLANTIRNWRRGN
jgi:hypothetical protein